MEPIFAAENIDAGYGDVIIVHDVSVRVAEGEIVAIVGPNGSGKSTLIKSCLGFVRLFRGSVFYQGKDITGIASDRAVSMGIGYVPQINNIFPNLTIRENLDLGAYHRKGKASIKAGMAEIYEMFPELEVRKNVLAGSLSGGERQMLAIARAMMAEPKVLLLDEPLASLSPKPTSAILSKMERIKEAGIAIVIVEQNVKKALSVSSRGYVLVNGTCVMEGEAASLFAVDSSKQRFLGLKAKGAFNNSTCHSERSEEP
ncbi:MAG: ABC transporter ATP-binding protein [Chloroflexi bacterium CG07_land_8_20_14_0_80_45_17]|nr:MAG: ABC transporter ATP-binding protein [Chloroflexi bacterium CG23_combo_of_CG06-09_8_20_14_all_45_10]PIU56151.1 MAG: ABC transporter ATP-binding protein [Chloroflexi bacterium CG07_land_8_20_14_0_80_45_17]